MGVSSFTPQFFEFSSLVKKKLDGDSCFFHYYHFLSSSIPIIFQFFEFSPLFSKLGDFFIWTPDTCTLPRL